MGRFGTAWKAFWEILRSEDAAGRWTATETGETKALSPAPLEPDTPPEESFPADAVYTLSLLQREGRLIDFLQEDIDGFQDAQVGAAVRQIHANCRTVLEKYFGITPLRNQPEGSAVHLEIGFDPRHVKVTGAATGEPPFDGSLRHRGWQASSVHLPSRHDKLDPSVVCPAEVEVHR